MNIRKVYQTTVNLYGDAHTYVRGIPFLCINMNAEQYGLD